MSRPIGELLPDTDALTVNVAGNCMSDTISDGDRVFCRSRRFYLPGDILLFRNSTGDLVCHRFLGHVRHGGNWKLMTHADNSSRWDGLIDRAKVIGAVMEVNGDTFQVSPIDRFNSTARFLRVAIERLMK